MAVQCSLAQIGLLGLIEWEWIETLATLEPQDVDYTDFVETAKKLVPELQEEVSVCFTYCTCGGSTQYSHVQQMWLHFYWTVNTRN